MRGESRTHMARTEPTARASLITPPGEGGIGIVALSGPGAAAVLGRFFRGTRRQVGDILPGSIAHGRIVRDGATVDEVIVAHFEPPSSPTGELFYGAGMFRELMEKQACDLLEPDIPRSGGAIETRRIAELAQMYHMSIAPHYMASTISGIAAVHICSTIPNFLALEYHSHNTPLWGRMLDLKDPIQNGYMTVPDGPGLGIELDEEEIAAYLPAGAPLWS